MPRRIFLAMGCAIAAWCASAEAAIDYRGINLSAAAFGHYNDDGPAGNALPGVHGTDYVYPDSSDFDYFHGLGMNTFRIPFRWERIQPTPGGALDGAELDRLASVVDYATSLGAHVILDVHNYARYITDTEVLTLGTPALTDADFANLWTRLSTEFAANEHVIFGLMNEPYGMDTETVVSFTNAALSAIRATGATNLALVEGNGFSGGHSWLQDWYGTPNATAMLDIVDPGNNLAFEVHQYVNNEGIDDIRYSGLTDHVESATVVPEQLAGFTDWLRTNNRRGFLGELGTPASDLGVEAMANGIGFVEENSDVWLGWTLWSGGPWWDDPDAGKRYHLSLNPLPDGSTAPQLEALSGYLNPIPEPRVWILCAIAGVAVLLSRGRARRRT